MMLKIRNVGPKDFGSYKCVAQNSLGGTDGVIKLDGKHLFVYLFFFFFDPLIWTLAPFHSIQDLFSIQSLSLYVLKQSMNLGEGQLFNRQCSLF